MMDRQLRHHPRSMHGIHRSAYRSGQMVVRKKRLSGCITVQTHDSHPLISTLQAGALYVPTCDRQSKLRSPRSHPRIHASALAYDLEHVEFFELVIITHHAHTAGALYLHGKQKKR